jgi:CubicO group peptidase (beta-lactamase class C family)
MLQERKMLSIDDKISKYFEVPKSMEKITIENLLNHTSGILDYWLNDISHEKNTVLQFVFDKDTLEFETGTKHLYCNSGYFLLGQIVEIVSGMSYGNFLNTNIFEPLNMKNTIVFDGKNYDRAIGYDENWKINDYLITSADGGIISTVEDLYLWDKALMENKILSAKARN